LWEEGLKMRALIVDDEEKLRESLAFMLNKFCPAVEVVASASSADEARYYLRFHDAEIIFLDISMPGENGFQFLESIQKEKYSVVFVTAHDEYAIRAFKVNAVDYLLKPVDVQELKTTMNRLEHLHHLKNENYIWKENYSDTLTDLLHKLRDHRPMEKIAVHHQQGFTLLLLSEIIYLEADSNYTILHLQAGQKIISTKTLSEYEELLRDSIFFRIHKSTLINLRQLKEYSRVDGDFAVMNDKTRLDISRRRLPLFLEKMSTFSAHT
jgi:two-component system LytT family response regulator